MGDKTLGVLLVTAGILVVLCIYDSSYNAGFEAGRKIAVDRVEHLDPVVNSGKILSTIAYPEQGRYYVTVKGERGKTETWEVSKEYFDKVILGAPINRRDVEGGKENGKS